MENDPNAQLSEDEKRQKALSSFEYVEQIALTEAETRQKIDEQLRRAGWEADTETLNAWKCGTKPMANHNLAIAEWPLTDGKRADYALFIGLKLYGLIEAKKQSKNVRSDIGQAKVYAEKVGSASEFLLRPSESWDGFWVPFVFATNGRDYQPLIEDKSGIWMQDLRENTNHPKVLKGWPAPNDLKAAYEINVEQAEKALQKEPFDYLKDPNGLNLRNYQLAAIEAVERAILDGRSQALVAMATGTGKTRMILGLIYRLLKANRFKRILFLVDRTLLGEQTTNVAKEARIESLMTLNQFYDVKKLEDKAPETNTRLQIATVQGMVRRLMNPAENEPVPTVGQYDCIIVDEAHRGYNLDREMSDAEIEYKDHDDFVSKYKYVLDYFDAFRIGLTATPALHTVDVFGAPVYRYTYRQAVLDGYLIDHEPPFIIRTELNTQGVMFTAEKPATVYNRRTGEVLQLDNLQDEIEFQVEHFNRAVQTDNFNRTVCAALAQSLDPDAPAKTLIFAASDEHADKVVAFLKEAFTEAGYDVPDDAIMKLTGSVYEVENWVKRYKNEQYPNIAVTVDLLSTGIDVPRISNIVFLRRVKSRILYEQMLGRATRRADDIGKEVFHIYDAVRLYDDLQDFTEMKPVVKNPSFTMEQLYDELDNIATPQALTEHIEQIVARIRRKSHNLTDELRQSFADYTDGLSPKALADLLLQLTPEQAADKLLSLKPLLLRLDKTYKTDRDLVYISEHEDFLHAVERGYGNGLKPEDYLEKFKQFLIQNKNQIDALTLVCTRPRSLTRKSLKELRLALDQHGYNEAQLKAAWKDAKNEELAADVVTLIRSLAVGVALIPVQKRVQNAVEKVRKMGDWSKIQLRWIDNIERQMLKETVFTIDDLNEEPFKADGGRNRAEKIFQGRLPQLFETLTAALYDETA